MKRVLKIRLNVNLPIKDLYFYTFATSVYVNFLSLLSTSMHIFSLRQASQIHVFVIFPFAEFFRVYIKYLFINGIFFIYNFIVVFTLRRELRLKLSRRYSHAINYINETLHNTCFEYYFITNKPLLSISKTINGNAINCEYFARIG